MYVKRNLDLIREILLAFEDYEPEAAHHLQSITPRDFSGTEAQNYYHIRLLLGSSFIDLAGSPDLQGEHPVKGLTMEGHDFLDAIRERSVWEVTKQRLSGVGGWTLEIVFAVAQEEIKKRLGLSLQSD